MFTGVVTAVFNCLTDRWSSCAAISGKMRKPRSCNCYLASARWTPSRSLAYVGIKIGVKNTRRVVPKADRVAMVYDSTMIHSQELHLIAIYSTKFELNPQ